MLADPTSVACVTFSKEKCLPVFDSNAFVLIGSKSVWTANGFCTGSCKSRYQYRPAAIGTHHSEGIRGRESIPDACDHGEPGKNHQDTALELS
mmetsp:Transcript_36825/g.57573  ORF Transcript_36825/g.57573 Transcript_36825/m.57573 type:complete len:93 (+) Transcript_36825:831-1109(+)